MQTIVIIIKIAFQSKVDHPRMCVSSYACMYFCFCDLDLDPMTLTMKFWIVHSNIDLQYLVCLSMLWATIKDNHKLV